MSCSEDYVPGFVVQKHDARQLHYDVRLLIDGVLKSWAVPKGPSLDPGDKRLAVEVEDHDPDYADFEGVIPDGHYGAGPVLVWDRGGCRNLRTDRDLAASHHQGLIEFWLDGQKLRGGFALKRFRRGAKPWWLLIKMKDDHARRGMDTSVLDPHSVQSGRTLDTITGQAGQL